MLIQNNWIDSINIINEWSKFIQSDSIKGI